jgi:IS5 family transposase
MYVKNMYSSQCVGRNHTDRGRKALKLSAVVDQGGVPHGLCCHPGNRPDVTLLEDSLNSCMTSLDTLAPLYADRGYDSRNNRRVCGMHGVKDRIFRRRTKTTRRTNARRIVVEHTFAWLKQYRRLLYMFEHSADQFLAFTILAFGQILARRMQCVPKRKTEIPKKRDAANV